jgi:hypothetical protein
MSARLEKFGNHVVKSDLGWTVDTSVFWFFLYRDATVEAKVAVEGAGTFLSPCLVGFRTMEVKELEAPDRAKQLRAKKSRIEYPRLSSL